MPKGGGKRLFYLNRLLRNEEPAPAPRESRLRTRRTRPTTPVTGDSAHQTRPPRLSFPRGSFTRFLRPFIRVSIDGTRDPIIPLRVTVIFLWRNRNFTARRGLLDARICSGDRWSYWMDDFFLLGSVCSGIEEYRECLKSDNGIFYTLVTCNAEICFLNKHFSSDR